MSLFKKPSRKKSSIIQKKPTANEDSDSFSSGDERSSVIKTGSYDRNKRKHGDDDGVGVSYTPSGSKTFSGTNEATKEQGWHPNDEINKMSGNEAGINEMGNLYRGQAAYSSYVPKRAGVSKKARAGPIKAPTNVRTVTIVDYQPDVCKDYKETGYCGFGDSCKFLHDRGDYKAGWQLDREWEDVQKRRIGAPSQDDDESSSDEDIPFACFICREPYKSPIVTHCGHYFCERCALQRYRKNPSCAICGAGTNGVFNTAKTLIAKLDTRSKKLQLHENDRTDGSGDGKSE